MSITITVPNDDHVALRAMAKALEEIAVARGAPAHSLQVTMGPICTVPMSPEQEDVLRERLKRIKDSETRAKADGADPISQEVRAAQVDTTSQQVESLSSVVNREVHFDNPSPQVSDNTTDSTGTPWDERIHSASKALNSDATWRLRRKPKDMDETEWSQFVDAVQTYITSDEEDLERLFPTGFDVNYKANFNESMEAWEKSKQPDYQPEPSVTPEGDDFHGDAGEVTEQQIASIPVPPLPVPPMPPMQQSDMTFPQVMQFLTERHGRITSAQVDDIIATMGLNSIMDLNTQPEHTGPFIARVKALLGE